MSELKTSHPATGHPEQPQPGEIPLSSTAGTEDADSFDLSLELAEILATFTPQESPEVANQTLRQADAGPAAPPIAAAASNQPDRAQFNSHDLNKRRAYRHKLHWRVAIINKGSGKNDINHGRTHDLSLTGVSILIERNVTFSSEVVILLAIPPMHLGQKETLVEIQCSTTYSLLDSVHSQFRLGMKFIHFKGDGKNILSDILAKRHIPKDESRPFAEIE